MTTTEKTQPDLLAFYVPEREKARWVQIGAAWKHKDGKGLTIDLDLMPTTDRKIVLRVNEPNQEAGA